MTRRHALSTRLWHWLNAAAVAVLFMSGLNISNAHPWLYWGQAGFLPAEAWLALPQFPYWATIPGYYSLAEARSWHLLAAWFFALAFTGYLIAGLANGHLRRDIATRLSEWRWPAIREDLARHVRLNFSPPPGRLYNFLQKLLYGMIVFVALPLMIFTGLALSPAMDAAWPWLTESFGGRQSARSIHFVTAWVLLAFFLVHIVALLLYRPLAETRDMITGGQLEGERR